MEFAGWKAHRDCDDAWFVIDAAGNGRWAKRGRRGAAGGVELLPLSQRGKGVGHGPLGQRGLLRHLDRKQGIRLDHSGAICFFGHVVDKTVSK